MTRNVVKPPRISVPMVEPAALTPNWLSIQPPALIVLLRAAIFPSLALIASGAGHDIATPLRGLTPACVGGGRGVRKQAGFYGGERRASRGIGGGLGIREGA